MKETSQIFSWSLHNPEVKKIEAIDFQNCFEIFLEFENFLFLEPNLLGIHWVDLDNSNVVKFSSGIKHLYEKKFNKISMINILIIKQLNN